MTNQNENSPKGGHERAVNLLNVVDDLCMTDYELLYVHLGMCDRIIRITQDNQDINTDETTYDPEPFHGDGYDRYVENLIQDIQDEQENSVDDLA